MTPDGKARARAPATPADVARARERGAAFALETGGALDRLRAEALAGRAGAGAAEVARALDASLGETPGVAGSLAALEVLDDLGERRAPPVERLCAGLARLQQDDGSFGDAACASEEDRAAATGRLAGLLARTPWTRPEVLDAAADFLAARFTPDLLAGFAWDAIASYAACFANVLHDDADAILQWCGRELERGFRARRFDAVATARVLLACDAHALPGARLTAPELVAALLAEQQKDGGWLPLADPSPHLRTDHTLTALAALGRLGA